MDLGRFDWIIRWSELTGCSLDDALMFTGILWFVFIALFLGLLISLPTLEGGFIRLRRSCSFCFATGFGARTKPNRNTIAGRCCADPLPLRRWLVLHHSSQGGVPSCFRFFVTSS